MRYFVSRCELIVTQNHYSIPMAIVPPVIIVHEKSTFNFINLSNPAGEEAEHKLLCSSLKRL